MITLEQLALFGAGFVIGLAILLVRETLARGGNR